MPVLSIVEGCDLQILATWMIVGLLEATLLAGIAACQVVLLLLSLIITGTCILWQTIATGRKIWLTP